MADEQAYGGIDIGDLPERRCRPQMNDELRSVAFLAFEPLEGVDEHRQVRRVIGGQFAEYVLAVQGRPALARFFDEAVALGFDTIEISDNCVALTDAERREVIGEAIAAGLSVFGEVGSKDRKSTAEDLIEQAGVCFAAGSELVLVEAAEFVDNGRLNDDLIGAVTSRLDMARVMIELPGPWISGVTLAQVYDMRKLLIRAFGPNVNIANVKPDDVFDTEALRVGLGVVGPTDRVT